MCGAFHGLAEALVSERSMMLGVVRIWNVAVAGERKRERERDYKTKHWVKECRMLQEKSSYILTLKYVAVIWITALTRAFVVFFGWYTNAHIRGRSYRACGDPIEVCGGCYRVHERFVRSLYVVECCSFEMSHTRAFVTVLRGSV